MVDIVKPAVRPGGARDLVTQLLGLWLLLAVFLDGWAHLNMPALETFFSPWHAALYSGFAVTAAWVAAVIWRNHQAGKSFAKAIPAGYRGTLVGIVLFGFAGGLDLAWHELLGIEVSLDALVSPTHLLLGFSLFLIMGTGIRSARADSGEGTFEWTPPALLGIVLMTGLGAFFLIYCSAFARTSPAALFVPTPVGSPGHTESEMPVIIGLASYLLTTALIVTPFLYVLSTVRRPTPGIVTMLVAVVAWLPVVMVGFRPTAIVGAAGGTVAAVLGDLLIMRLPTRWLSRKLPAVSAGLAALVWSGQLLALALAVGIRWPLSMWLGAVVLSSAMAAGLALLSSWSPAGKGG
jgi:hypothetical protein